MSLVRLLELGRSLNVIEATQSRYRMPRQNLLPKFGKAGVAIGLSPITATSAADSTAPSRLLSSLTNVVERPIKREHANSKGVELILRFPNYLGRVRKFFGEAMKLLSKLAAQSGTTRLALRRRSASPAVILSRLNTTQVQTVLSLDNVTVVRNDLSDMSLESVPPTLTQVSLKQSPPAQVVAALNGSWGRLKARLFQVPVGYQNEAGFHLGEKPAEKESGWPPFW